MLLIALTTLLILVLAFPFIYNGDNIDPPPICEYEYLKQASKTCTTHMFTQQVAYISLDEYFSVYNRKEATVDCKVQYSHIDVDISEKYISAHT